jgi:hypothetical protein
MKRQHKNLKVILFFTYFLIQIFFVYGQISYPPQWSYETGGIIGSISISSDGNYIAAGSHDAKIYFFNRSGIILWSYEVGEITEEESVLYHLTEAT